MVLATAASVHANDEFPVPPGLAPAVRFWVDVFTRYSRDDVIVHDRLDPARIYGVIHASEAQDEDRIQGLLDRIALGQLHEPDPVDRLLVPDQLPRPDGPIGPERIHLQRGMREVFHQGLVAGRRYRAIVEAVLAREGLPLDLAALPLVESSYNPHATSSAGAAGIWQFTQATAQQYLRPGRRPRGDARRDPVQATEAAARLLRDLREMFPSWPLALTAYNHGPTGVERARRALGTDDLGTVVSRYQGPRFGFASRNYYAEFVAARHVQQHVARYFPDIAPNRLIEYQVKRGDTLAEVAQRHGVPLTKLISSNGLDSRRAKRLQPGDVLMIRL
ncbi:MAG: transglycosylase SLT domain-containing protein [Candidatus Binatia bacterium]